MNLIFDKDVNKEKFEIINFYVENNKKWRAKFTRGKIKSALGKMSGMTGRLGHFVE